MKNRYHVITCVRSSRDGRWYYAAVARRKSATTAAALAQRIADGDCLRYGRTIYRGADSHVEVYDARIGRSIWEASPAMVRTVGEVGWW